MNDWFPNNTPSTPERAWPTSPSARSLGPALSLSPTTPFPAAPEIYTTIKAELDTFGASPRRPQPPRSPDLSCCDGRRPSIPPLEWDSTGRSLATSMTLARHIIRPPMRRIILLTNGDNFPSHLLPATRPDANNTPIRSATARNQYCHTYSALDLVTPLRLIMVRKMAVAKVSSRPSRVTRLGLGIPVVVASLFPP